MLYFIVQDLQKLNPMYKFSLAWFKDLTGKALALTNKLKDDVGAAPTGDGDDDAGDAAAKIMSNSFSVDERVALLCKTITAEVFKRLQIALFAADRQLAMYMIAARVQEAENFLEPKLFEFVLKGSRAISPTATVPVSLHGYAVPGLTNMAWADLQYLASLKPFNVVLDAGSGVLLSGSITSASPGVTLPYILVSPISNAMSGIVATARSRSPRRRYGGWRALWKQKPWISAYDSRMLQISPRLVIGQFRAAQGQALDPANPQSLKNA